MVDREMENKVGGEDDEYKREGIAGSKGSIYLSSFYRNWRKQKKSDITNMQFEDIPIITKEMIGPGAGKVAIIVKIYHGRSDRKAGQDQNLRYYGKIFRNLLGSCR